LGTNDKTTLNFEFRRIFQAISSSVSNSTTGIKTTTATFLLLFTILAASIIVSPLFMGQGIISIEKAYGQSSSPYSSSYRTSSSGPYRSSYSTTMTPTSPTSTGTTYATTATSPTTAALAAQKPIAIPTSVSTQENTPVTITLTAKGSTTNPLKFAISSSPSHGILGPLSSTGSFSASITYSPVTNFAGSDSFYFAVMDAATGSISPSAQVSITVVNSAPVSGASHSSQSNDLGSYSTSGPTTTLATTTTPLAAQKTTNNPPVANAQRVTTNEDTPKSITLTATDKEGNTLTYSVVSGSGPTHGTLSCTTCQTPTYTPALNYFGSDSFQFKANDGTSDSKSASVSITVTSVNDPPVANAGSDKAVTSGNTVSLDGTGSSDIDDGIKSYSWKQTAGTHVTLKQSTSATSSFTAPTVTQPAILTFTVDRTAPTVTAFPAGGTYNTAQSVTLFSSSPGTAIYYTTDGSDPSTTTGTKYTSPITINNEGTTTLKFIGVDTAGNQGAIKTETYTILDTTPPTVVGVEPADGASAVPVDIPSITATFSEPMDSSTINTITFTLPWVILFQELLY
jgi:Chitobiase/beta-hexosaminidase C-terminal domain/Bacterial Ig domain/Bacterial Ig-like domain/PKD domain